VPNLQDIRRRIASVKSTQKITRAMKMVAASKLRRSQEALLNTRPYTYRMRELVRSLLTSVDPDSHPLLQRGKSGKVAILVVSSDRGLCGGYNANVVNETMRILREQFAGKTVELTIVGRKAHDALRRRQCNIRTAHLGLLDRYTVNSDTAVILPLVNAFVKGEVGEVYCLYNEFKSAIAQKIAFERLLPYELEQHDGKKEPYYIFEPSAEDVVFSLLRDNLCAQMHRILHEAMASEQGARMAAMDAATNNARDVIAKLTLKYNRVRQDAITKEVVEIVSGAEAL
jgi:F-type H+-transporting ATPase subunit gamma